MDISGAFDTISKKAIIEGLNRKSIPKFIINWYEYYLTNRRAEAKIHDSKITRFLRMGIPQGSVLSSSAWNMGIDDIVENANIGPSQVVAFADDLFVMITRIDPDTLVDLAQPTIDKIKTLCENVSVK